MSKQLILARYLDLGMLERNLIFLNRTNSALYTFPYQLRI